MPCIANNSPNFKIFQWQACLVQVCKLSDEGHICHTCSSRISTCVCFTNILILLLLLSCSIAICYIKWCLLLLFIGLDVIFFMLSTSPTPVLLPSNFFTKNHKSCKVVFCSSSSLSTSSMISLYAFCINRISFFLFDTMSDFSSVFTPNCANDRSNSVVWSFGKQLSILSESFSKSYISLVGLLLKT